MVKKPVAPLQQRPDLPEGEHWADTHIAWEPLGEGFIAYDEAGVPHGLYLTRGDARVALQERAKYLELSDRNKD